MKIYPIATNRLPNNKNITFKNNSEPVANTVVNADSTEFKSAYGVNNARKASSKGFISKLNAFINQTPSFDFRKTEPRYSEIPWADMRF